MRNVLGKVKVCCLLVLAMVMLAGASTTSAQAYDITGKIIAVKSNVITVRLNKTDERTLPRVGDEVKVSYKIGGDVVNVGSWRVSKIVDAKTLEADLEKAEGEPNIGMDAVVRATGWVGRRGSPAQPVLPAASGNVQRLNIECTQGQAAQCTSLGYMYGTGSGGVARDYQRARELYRRGCDGGDMRGCSNLGVLVRDGLGAEADPSTAATWFEKACEGGSAQACTDLGFQAGTGTGIALDYGKALALYRKACNGGEMTGCKNLGIMHRDGLGTARDPAAAVPWFDKGCEGGNAQACMELGNFYLNGTGVSSNPARAAGLFRKACDGKDMIGCNNLGLLYQRGLGVNRDPGRATDLYDKACRAGYELGCKNLAQMRGG